MTELREEASVLPLSVTYTPDGQIAAALEALVGRVGQLAGDAERARPFVTAVQDVVRWLGTHPEAVSGDVALVFDRADGTLSGDLRWAAASAGEPTVPTPSADAGVKVRCDASGSDVHCRVTCVCA